MTAPMTGPMTEPMTGPMTGQRERAVAPVPPPGWYPDPSDPSLKRYWDGTSWRNMAVPATGLPQLPAAPPDQTSDLVTRPVFEYAPTRPRPPRWTTGRVMNMVAVLVLGWWGWGAAVVGLADLLTQDDLSALVAGYIGMAVLPVWAFVVIMTFADRGDHYWRSVARRAWWLAGAGWLMVLAVGIATGFVTALSV